MSSASVDDWLRDEAQLAHVADIDGDGMPDREQIEAALRKAANEMNGWLAARYPVLPAQARDTLAMHQIRIATQHLAATAQSSTDAIKDAYKASIDYLKQVARGAADLPGTTAPGDDIDGGDGGIQMVAPERVFSRDTMKGF